ncbi:hypothetical protein Shewana3_3391 [Shewanella sp. ANA-3]|uniref:hypothetical protein n=1 Tax=Shewanella sp. (strain ANA-3) TaxID=94122 RepID=UPI00005DD45F|nr:hypothetical protein [Shewanella sp. ANA-3]ABK49614.1 hypothetical protein Shewana3_3391 [Shewanella sp. ANA-3]
MHIDQTAKNYLLDLGNILSEYAVEAKVDALAKSETQGHDFAQGYLMGLHRVITLMQQQAEAFSLSLADVGLAKIDEDFFFDNRREL